MFSITIVAGPTASGKSDLATKLAAEQRGVLINADSQQVYKYLDIGTNKDQIRYNDALPTNLWGTPFYLVDFLEPDKQYNVSDFQRDAFELLQKFKAENTPVVIVGGTGLYIDSVLHPEKYVFDQEALNLELRKELDSKDWCELKDIAIQLDAEAFGRLNESDRNNPRRLVRLIEKAGKAENESASSATQSQISSEIASRFEDFRSQIREAKIRYLDWPMEELTERINRRVEKMWEMGIVDEVQQVLLKGFSPEIPILQNSTYKPVLDFIQGNITQEKAIELLKTAHRQYAKRQVTWFKKYLLTQDGVEVVKNGIGS